MQVFSLGQQWKRVMCAVVLACAATGCGVPTIAPAAPQAAKPTVLPTAAVAPIPVQPTVTAVPSATTAPIATAAPTATAVPSPRPAPPTATPEPVVETIDPALASELQRILDQLVADGSIPGAVLTVHIPGYQPWSGASGFVDRQRSAPMETSTQVRIASISKVFTAVVMLQLVEEGKVDLDMPLSTWFPELVPNAGSITVRNLLQHTSGLYDYLEDKNYLGQAYQRPDYVWPPAELVSYAAQFPPAFQPSAPGAWDYSSTNYVILGMIVEQVTGNTLAHEMRERIFVPLGLNDTYFPPNDTVEGMQARGYRYDVDNTNLSLSFAFATANIVSTTSDVQRFGDGLFGGELLKPETMEMMLTFENGHGQYGMPQLEYGLGVMRNVLPVGGDIHGQARAPSASTVMGHTGGFGGFRSVLWHNPDSGVTIALGENQGATDPNILATSVFQAILAAQGR